LHRIGAVGSVGAMGVAVGAAAGAGARVDQAGEQRLARIESLRALAALGVLAGHAWGAHYAFGPDAMRGLPARTIFGGGFGVFVFFALSGYLLYRPLVAATFGGGHVDLRRYAINRVLRTLPLYYAVVAILLVVQEGGGTPGQWLRFATLTENLFRSTALTVDGPIWSLIVELQFYALLPFVALGLARVTRRSRRSAAAILIAIGIGGAVLRHALIAGHQADPRVVYSMLTTSFFFVPGMLLALVREVRLPGILHHSDTWLLASLPVWLWIFEDYGRTSWAAVASFLVVGGVALPLRQGVLARALDWRPLALVGVASYSLYLWHLPIVEALTPGAVLVSVPLSLLAALVSYRLVEAPFLRLRRRWSSSAYSAT
jgi:peptidoglycan/LPS O-acetylase OafA/YrhL